MLLVVGHLEGVEDAVMIAVQDPEEGLGVRPHLGAVDAALPPPIDLSEPLRHRIGLAGLAAKWLPGRADEEGWAGGARLMRAVAMAANVTATGCLCRAG